MATELDTSKTSPTSQTEGKVCTFGRFITEEEGEKILTVADTWVGTEYAKVGAKSVKRMTGDCSGTTNKIYAEAGFLYPYQMTSTFIDFVEKTNRFREIKNTERLQAGDVLYWEWHVAIYATFQEGSPRRNTGLKLKGALIDNDMYTAHRLGGEAYGPHNTKVFRPNQPYRAFRYFLHSGEAGC